MCTVTYYKRGEEVIITSNRDEHIHRASALLIHAEELEGYKCFYPRDPLAGGSWFGYRNDAAVLVLLNGAFQKHTRNMPYDRSRGLVLLEILRQQNFHEAWDYCSLDGVEPFTLVSYQNGKLVERIWDGSKKHAQMLNENEPHIWSSVTLYDEAERAVRKNLFNEFLLKNTKDKSSLDFIEFHSKPNGSNLQTLMINRADGMLTKNMTQVYIHSKKALLYHRDLLSDHEQTLSLDYHGNLVS